MPDLIFLLGNPAYIELPYGLSGWVGLAVLIGVEAVLLRRWQRYNRPWNRIRRSIFFLLALLVPVTSLILPGVRFWSGETLPPPLVPQEPITPTMMVFAPLPWALAAGFLGPAPAAGIAMFSGLLLSLWNNHNPYLPFELALLSILFSVAMHQRYRTLIFRVLRHPIVTAPLLGLGYAALFLVDSVLLAQGILAARLDFTLTHLGTNVLAVSISLFVVGAFVEVIAHAVPAYWGGQGVLRPSPTESSLRTRFLTNLLILLLILAVAMMVWDWYIAGRAARQMLEGRMANAADMAVKSVPYFLETGQNQIMELVKDPKSYTVNPERLYDLLAQDIRAVPYFSQLIIYDSNGDLRTAYPRDALDKFPLTPEEQSGIGYALKRVGIQYFTVPPRPGSRGALISYMAVILDSSENIRGILVARSDLNTNPFAQPLLTSLESVSEIGGEGILLDENDDIIYHPNPDMVLQRYTGLISGSELFYEETAPDGTRQLVYSQPVIGRGWSVLVTVPARYAQQQVLSIAAPLLGMIVVLAIIALVLIRFGLSIVTRSLQDLAIEAKRMADGQLDNPLKVYAEDEVGQLRRAFEQLRVNLKARVDDLNRLLGVSQGVASSLEIEKSMQLILESALSTRAASARVVLAPEVIPQLDGDSFTTRLGLGPDSELYRSLDDQILSLSRQQDRLLLANLERPRLLVISPGYPKPKALAAMALRHEGQFYGSLWLAYDQARQFPEEEVHFLVTLSGQAALAAAKACLFQRVEISRQQLEAIFASIPDPVMVTNQQNRLIMANPAAWKVFGFNLEKSRGQLLENVVSHPSLKEILPFTAKEPRSIELLMPDGSTYLVTASPFQVDGQHIGRVLLLRDITEFKRLDTLKSEFVSTVSHDLRSPLTEIDGYARMLQMVGELNEQQSTFVRNIIADVEGMLRLVSNLLDLGRIEAGVGLKLEMVPAQEIVERVVNALQLQAAQKRIQLTTEIPKYTIPLVKADQALLQQALHNLVENAIKFTGSGGYVRVGLNVQEDYMIFHVRDTGIGIAPADHQRLFEKFFRALRVGVKSERGSGLGLAIVKSIAEKHGGRVWLKSQLGKGSTFFMAIPAGRRRIH